MSTSTLESRASARALDEVWAESDRAQAVERSLFAEFIGAARKADMKATAWFGSLVTDYSTPAKTKRRETVGEVIYDTLVYDDFSDEAMAILCAVSMGMDREGAAADLIKRMAAKYAHLNCSN